MEKRDHTKCQWRTGIRADEDGKEKADCGLVPQITGIRDRDCLDSVRVPEGACRLCCVEAEPSEEGVNPTVASRLINVTAEVLRRKGVRGCTPAHALRLQNWAAPQLMQLAFCPAPIDMIEIPYTGSCFHLGEQNGTAPCDECRGNVVRKVFECRHELHEETMIINCKRCQDYDQPLKNGSVESWSVGVVTAPRKVWTLGRTLRSLARAGWSKPQVFAEPRSRLPARFPASRLTQRSRKLGAWPNYLLALNEMLLADPLADAYMLCEDDVIFTSGLRAYLEENLWPEKRLGVVSLYTPSHEEQELENGFYNIGTRGAWGSLAYVFPNAAARLIVRHPRIVNHRSRGPRKGLIDADVNVGRWCTDADLSYWLHTPSLAQHIGETSTIWGDTRPDPRRNAATFPGESVDINAMMRKRRPRRNSA